MPRATHFQTAFNAGEWRGTLDGRVDQARYRGAARRLRNMVPLVEGPAEKRPGMRFVEYGISQSDPDKPSTLIPFKFNADVAYVLEFGEFEMRVYRDNGVVESSPGIPYSIATVFPASETHKVQFRQSADVMFLAHPDYPPQRLSRTGDTAWLLEDYDPDWAPFDEENFDTSLTLQASAATGAGITITASSALFTANDVGRLVKFRELVPSQHALWATAVDPISLDTGVAAVAGTSTCYWEGNAPLLTTKPGAATGTRPPIHEIGTETDGKWTWTYLHSGAGYARITAFTDSTHVVADVVHQLPASVVAATTYRWAWGAWDAVSGYPRALSFFEDRLWWGGSTGSPDKVWATRPGGAYDDFREDETAEGGLLFRLNADEPNIIETIVGGKVLYLITAGGIFPAAGADPTKAVSIENLLSAERNIAYGARQYVSGLAVENIVLFVQRSGRAIREILFNFDEDSFVAPDLAKISAHLIAGGVKRLAYQQEPYRTLWALLETGEVAAATYDRPQEVIGWWKLEPGGSDPVVEGLAVIPHPDGDVDQVWLAIRRNFNGIVTRSIEFIEKPFLETSAIEDAFYVDSGLTYDGTPKTHITGLNHLEGQTVRILADGARVADQVVSSNRIILDTAASKVQVGLGYDGLLVPMRLEAGGDDGPAQGKTKRIHRVVIRLFRTGEGLYFGASEELADMDEAVFRDAFDEMDNPVDLVDGDTIALPWPGEYEQGGFVSMRHAGPTPCTIVAVSAQLTTGER